MTNLNNTNIADVDNLSALSRAKNFLGREFLTWLWWTAETSPELSVHCKGLNKRSAPISIWVDDRIVLDSTSGHTHTQALRGGDPSRSPEAAYGLKSGKDVKELRLGVRIDPIGEYRCTLERGDLSPKSLVMPTTDEMKTLDPELLVDARLRQLEIFKEILDELFRKFLDSRIAPTWENDTLNEMRAWVHSRAKSKFDKVVH